MVAARKARDYKGALERARDGGHADGFLRERCWFQSDGIAEVHVFAPPRGRVYSLAYWSMVSS